MSGTRSAVQRPRSDALSECHHAFKWTVLPCMQEVLAPGSPRTSSTPWSSSRPAHGRISGGTCEKAVWLS